MGNTTLYYALLSGEHPTLPLAELQALLESRVGGRVVYAFEGAALFESTGDPSIITSLAGWVKEVGRVVTVGSAEESSILEALQSLRESGEEYGRLQVKKYKAYSPSIDESKIKAMAPLARARDKGMLRLFLTEGVFILGVILGVQETRGFYWRRPGKRAYFKPGPLSPQLSRVFVNLSRLPEGGVYLDPFCGTGGFAIEACLAGAGVCLCGDIDAGMAGGAWVNVKAYGDPGRSIVFRHDAANTPLRDESVDAIATDPPYGRSTTMAKRSYRALASRFLEEAARLLKPGGYVVYAGPLREEPWRLAGEHELRVTGRYHMHVHSTLVREVVVARKV